MATVRNASSTAKKTEPVPVTALGSRVICALLMTAAAATTGACGGIGPDKPDIGPPETANASSGSPSSAPLTGEISVLAASSLTEVLTELADRFEADHPGVSVATTFASSAAFATQLEAGAEADVIATADDRTMLRISERGLTTDLSAIATNRLEIAVKPGNPAGITGLADLAAVDISTVACVPEAPCGQLADDILSDQGLSVPFSTREPNVKATLAAVELGDADAALVYHTDVVAGDVDGVIIDSDRANRYPATVAANARNPEVAAAFVDYLTGDVGTQVISDFGFGLP